MPRLLSAPDKSPPAAAPPPAPAAQVVVGATPARFKAGRPVAVALAWDANKDELPRILASGHGTVAAQILELAFANGVKVREDGDLAQMLAALELDSEIPLEAIVAVAEILAHVYRANGTLPPAES